MASIVSGLVGAVCATTHPSETSTSSVSRTKENQETRLFTRIPHEARKSRRPNAQRREFTLPRRSSAVHRHRKISAGPAERPPAYMLESKQTQCRMLPDIENLLRLQDADKEIRRLQDEIAEFPKRVAVIEQKLAGTKSQLEKAQAAVKADEAARRKYDTAISDLRGKISK